MLIVQIPLAYSHCEVVAREAGQKQKEAMYRKKCLEGAAAISKIWENQMIKANQAQAKKMADLKKMMERVGLTL